jgi:hypothetical protein
MPSKATPDPGRQLAFEMADMEADDARFLDALGWLEAGTRRAPLPRSYREKRDAWLRQVRASRDVTPRSGRRRVSPQLPGD